MAHSFEGTAQSHMIDLPAGRFHYLSWGAEQTERPAMVLLHGITSSALSWVHVGPALAERYRVYALDMRGHGDSVTPGKGTYGLRYTADDAAAFIETLDLKRPVVVGHSWGGATAIVLASGAWSQKSVPPISQVILEDPAHNFGQGDPEKRAASFTKDIGRPADELRAQIKNDNPEWSDADIEGKVDALQKVSAEAVLNVFIEAGNDGDLLPFLHDIQVPTLLIGADPAVGSTLNADAWETAQRNLPVDSRAVRIDKAPHGIHRSSYTEFMQVVNDFLKPV